MGIGTGFRGVSLGDNYSNDTRICPKQQCLALAAFSTCTNSSAHLLVINYDHDDMVSIIGNIRCTMKVCKHLNHRVNAFIKLDQDLF